MGDGPLTPEERDEARALLADLGSLRYEFRTQDERHPSGWATWSGERSPAVLRAVDALLHGLSGFYGRYLDSIEAELNEALAAVKAQREHPQEWYLLATIEDERRDD